MTAQAYKGSCQCGAVRYEVNADLENIIACNCSRCGRLGLTLAFVPEDQFKLSSGGDELTEYLFNKQIIQHQFCKVCGVQPFARAIAPGGAPTMAINVRCLEGIDTNSLDPKMFDGRSL